MMVFAWCLFVFCVSFASGGDFACPLIAASASCRFFLKLCYGALGACRCAGIPVPGFFFTVFFCTPRPTYGCLVRSGHYGGRRFSFFLMFSAAIVIAAAIIASSSLATRRVARVVVAAAPTQRQQLSSKFLTTRCHERTTNGL